jgi:hypothetical protein
MKINQGAHAEWAGQDGELARLVHQRSSAWVVSNRSHRTDQQKS